MQTEKRHRLEEEGPAVRLVALTDGRRTVRPKDCWIRNARGINKKEGGVIEQWAIWKWYYGEVLSLGIDLVSRMTTGGSD